MIKDCQKLTENKGFVYLWTSQIFSQITAQTMLFILLFRLYDLTGSSLATSLLWVSYSLPAIFIGPVASVTVDIFDRRKILIITNLLQAFLIFSYSLFSGNSLLLLYLSVLVYSIFNQFNDPAEIASLTYLVEKTSLPNANSLFFITTQASIVVGVTVAGLSGKTLGFQLSLRLCSLLLFISFLTAVLLPKMKAVRKFSGRLEKDLVAFVNLLRSGYEFIKNTKEILYPFLVLIFMQIMLSVITVNVPVITQKLFILPNEYSGILVIPAAAGAFVGAILTPKELNMGKRKLSLVKRSFFLITLSFILLIFLIPQLSEIYRISYGALSIFVLGYAFISVVIPTQTLIQEKTPDSFRGRVFGNYGFLLTLITIFPIILSATVIEIVGIRMFFFLLGVLVFSILLSFDDREKIVLFIEKGVR